MLIQTQQSLEFELLKFKMFLSGQRIKKRIFVSAGSPADKAKILPAIRQLTEFNVDIFATEGTSAYLSANGVLNTRVYKIAEGKEPNAKSLLIAESFDLAINVLTGERDYDENSDADIIRDNAAEANVPLITDIDAAVQTISSLLEHIHARGPSFARDRVSMRDQFKGMVLRRGGYTNHHLHLDKAYLMTLQYLLLSQVNMEQKWYDYDRLKEDYTVENVNPRILHGLDQQYTLFGVRRARTQVDVDARVGLICLEAAELARKQMGDRLHVQLSTQTLQGVTDLEPRRFYEIAAERVDVIGGLPSRDRKPGCIGPGGHLDFIMDVAKRYKRPLEVHVDQQNNPLEDETEMLADYTMKHGLEGRVSAIHAIFSSKPEEKRREIIKKLRDAGITVIVCPAAALSMKPVEGLVPIHNSIAPVIELVEGGVKVVLGTDNVEDFFMPFTDGDMWMEVRMLMEACRWYDAEKIADMACDSSQFSALALAA